MRVRHYRRMWSELRPSSRGTRIECPTAKLTIEVDHTLGWTAASLRICHKSPEMPSLNVQRFSK